MCNEQELEIACANDIEELTDPHLYIAGCQESWVEGDHYFSVMHIPLYEWGRQVISHELLHAAETVMTVEEWQMIYELIITAFVELDENEMEALGLAGAFATFTEYETDTGDEETVGESIEIDFNDPTHIQELYALVGTLFRTLPADLEKHYARYFVDRQAIVDMEWEALDVDYYMRLLSN